MAPLVALQLITAGFHPEVLQREWMPTDLLRAFVVFDMPLGQDV